MTKDDSTKPRSRTLWVVDLLSTRVQSVRIELVGSESSTLTRLGAVLLYLPILLVGYVLLLTALMKVFALALGWGLTLFVFGAAHLAVSAWGISRGKSPGATRTYDVVDPAVVSPVVAHAAETMPPPPDTQPDLQRRLLLGHSAAPRPAAAAQLSARLSSRPFPPHPTVPGGAGTSPAPVSRALERAAKEKQPAFRSPGSRPG